MMSFCEVVGPDMIEISVSADASCNVEGVHASIQRALE
jgi:hypothetical protein